MQNYAQEDIPAACVDQPKHPAIQNFGCENFVALMFLGGGNCQEEMSTNDGVTEAVGEPVLGYVTATREATR